MGLGLAALDRVAKREGDDLHRRLFLLRPDALVQAVVDRHRTPRHAVRHYGNGQEGLDLLSLEILAQEAVDVAGKAGEHLALPAFLGDSPEQGVRCERRPGRSPSARIEMPSTVPSTQKAETHCVRPWPGSSCKRNRMDRWTDIERPSNSRTSSMSCRQSTARRRRCTMRAAATVALRSAGAVLLLGSIASILLRGVSGSKQFDQRSAASSPGSEKI